MTNDMAHFEHRRIVTFDDTNVVGNVYFSHYFQWMGECREVVIANHYPEIADDIRRGFGLATEYAHIDFKQEGLLFDHILVKMSIVDLTRTRIEFGFEFLNEKTGILLAVGRQAVVWVNQQHRPSLMPDKLYDSANNHIEMLKLKD